MTASKTLRYLVFYIAAFSDVIKSTHDVGFNVLSEHGILDYQEDGKSLKKKVVCR